MFVICSSWFLLDSNRTKLEKLFSILFDSICISIVVLIGFLCGGYELSSDLIVKQFFPEIFANVWFIRVYVIFYALHPLLNFIVEKLNQKQHFLLVFLLFIFFSLTGMFGEPIIDHMIIAFCIVYLLVAYFKKYAQEFCDSRKANLIGFVVFFGLFVVLAIAKFLLSINIGFFRTFPIFDDMYSPILFPALFFLFNLFRRIKIKKNWINYLASCTLFVYCIHDNMLLRIFIRPAYYEYVLSINSGAYFGWIMLCAIGMFVGAYLLAILYKETLHKLMVWLGQKVSIGTKWLFDKLYRLFEKKEEHSEE